MSCTAAGCALLSALVARIMPVAPTLIHGRTPLGGRDLPQAGEPADAEGWAQDIRAVVDRRPDGQTSGRPEGP